MTTEDQKLTNGSVKPADDPRKYSVNSAQIVCASLLVSAFTMQKFTKQETVSFSSIHVNLEVAGSNPALVILTPNKVFHFFILP